MLTLAIDTSTDNLGLALMESGQLRGEYNLSLKRQHSEKLLPLIEQIFELLGIQPRELNGVAVATGPGSFTGLRIGITTAKLLGRIFSIPVKGISTLEIMAAGIAEPYLLPLIDARRKRVYCSFYQNLRTANDNFLKEIYQPTAISIAELPELLSNYKEKEITLIGEKKKEVRRVLEANAFSTRLAEAESDLPRAAVLARLGENYFKTGQRDDIYQLKPAYLKKPQAEINWQQKYGNN
ncbi:MULTISPECIES: tRNA (adenosine(37)-N6)-threonylcarbamoyltransferase complex dimerization subunit type 1 TsaB [Halanaerobium]|jgi:tRNA threonylcarbamoyladenosine biosynthesis protein TsaB|uniref:tRNA threonylcarbamoyladenosine biosynthesis protein TsaB n=1 Tax=Halanaerobium kushneri TaxID=56779 RepID=A0A1N6W7B3_9FIRM|nr:MULTISPECIES: tRNA (adenosine(37)-N6)-threonylcarbamoyltransferase complex dimerization subunit type 1 TsaB [Halanaerobium]RCW54225.1 tRNA threonylcarbamoyladenosine biosynthesis protein TsaB [Halanaerobium sp. ST460_2HS_T2]SIQ85984.1 tRNA threonylcarbamoyladenosine biosynthesis protein TsaB [Halanaerobium kushneri]